MAALGTTLRLTKRKGTGMGVITQIMRILKSVSLGHFYFEMAVLLRESLLMNGILFNSEVWYSLTKAQVNELQEVDTLMLRKVMEVNKSVPISSLFLELGLTPIKQILQGRRVMYLHYLVSLKEEEMLSKFFYAQWDNPVKHDWTTTVKADIVELGINLELSQIRAMKKDKFADIVKKHAELLFFGS